jgi:hypothetical protein
MAITVQQFTTLEDLYGFYNQQLFGGILPACLVNLSRHREAVGYFIPREWTSLSGGDIRDEISLNPDSFYLGDEYWHSTLVHEMCHVWQFHFGKYSQYNYHNQQWATKMQAVGLMPSHTGKEGGNTTGQYMSDYVMEGGKFQQAFQSISQEDKNHLRLPYVKNMEVRLGDTTEGMTLLDELKALSLTLPAVKGGRGLATIRSIRNLQDLDSKSGKKVKYTCLCGNNVWGKGGLNLYCRDCQDDFMAQ